MTMAADERDDVGGGADLVGSAYPDLLRAAFAQALGTLIDALPEGAMRNAAVAEMIAAHQRTAERLARRRRLN
jgi:hypothetical protein